MDNGCTPRVQDHLLNLPFRSKKRIVKPLILEEQMNNIKQNESLAVILRFKRSLEFEISESDQIGKANVYKKLQIKHIRDENLSSGLEREDLVSMIKEGFDKDKEMNWKLFLKGLGSFEDEESFRRVYKTCYNDSIKKLQRENILKQKRVFLAKCNNIEISEECLLEQSGANDSMEIEKEIQHKREESPGSYHRRALSEGWVYF